MEPHSSTFAWKIPWTEEPGGLQSMGSLESDMTERLHFHFSLSRIAEGNGNPLQCSCLENPGDREAQRATVYGVTQSRTRLKRLSSSSNSKILFWQHHSKFSHSETMTIFKRQKGRRGLPKVIYCPLVLHWREQKKKFPCFNSVISLLKKMSQLSPQRKEQKTSVRQSGKQSFMGFLQLSILSFGAEWGKGLSFDCYICGNMVFLTVSTTITPKLIMTKQVEMDGSQEWLPVNEMGIRSIGQLFPIQEVI